MLILTALEMMRKGLRFSGYKDNGFVDYSKEHVQEEYMSFYGSDSIALAALWNEMQTTAIPEARIENATEKVLNYFLATHHWLKEYSSYNNLAKISKAIGGPDTCKAWTWAMVEKIAALKAAKIRWPDEFDDVNSIVYLYSVDGVHFRKQEEYHEEMSKNPKWYSHKGGGPGIMYEVAMHIWDCAIVWISGGHQASRHDKTVYTEPGGLCERTHPDKKGVGDRGYRTIKGAPRLPVCTPNSHNAEEVREFQGRARARQESFFGRCNNFKILKEEFRFPGLEKHGTVFDAICVILTFQFENGSPLFDV